MLKCSGVNRADHVQYNSLKCSVNTMNLVDMAQVRDCWRALVNAALNLHTHLIELEEKPRQKQE